VINDDPSDQIVVLDHEDFSSAKGRGRASSREKALAAEVHLLVGEIHEHIALPRKSDTAAR
jgi:hypothetical protein